MQTKTITKTLNFHDGCGNVYRKKCEFKLHNGVFSVYDCPAVEQLNNCVVSYAIVNEVHIQPKVLDDGSDADKNLYKKSNIKKFCAICTMKQNCGR
jgi:hypothetical protein